MNSDKSKGILITKWLWFSVLIPLVPIIFSIWKFAENNNIIVCIGKSISNGELVLLSIFIYTGLVGESIEIKEKYKISKYWIIGPLILCIILGSLSYSEWLIKSNVNENIRFITSIIYFGTSIILGCSVFIVLSLE